MFNLHNNNLFVKKISILIAIISIMFLSSCSFLPKEKVEPEPVLKEPPEPRVNLVQVEEGTITQEVSGLARVAAVKESPLYFTKSGRVKKIYVDYGDQVQQGDPLARLEVGDLEYNYKLAKLDLKKMEMQLDRMQTLAGNSVSEYELELKKIDYKKAKMKVDRLKGFLDASTIYAPFDGRVTSISMQEANKVEEYAKVITIADPSELELQMNVSSRDLQKIVPGLKAQVKLKQGYWVDAKVTEVPSLSAEISPGQPDRRVHMKLVNKSKIFNKFNISEKDILEFDNLLSAAIIIQKHENALLLPKSAVREYGDRTFVRIKEGETRKEVDIKIGLETKTKVEVLEGLEKNQKVIAR